MTKRARLKYFDSNNNEVIIGSIQDSGEEISELTLKNSAREFSKVTVVGGNELFGAFPTKSSEVTAQNNASGPEIFLEVFNNSTGNFEIRDRVFAESQGVVSDNGQFKHKRLYGFEKFVARQKVDLTGSNNVTTDIEEVLNEALPSGYVADVPSSASVPNVNDYRFKGRRGQVFKDLRENYNFIINFTGNTDSSGDYLVQFEPRGFGSLVDTFEKGVDPVFFEKWTKGDELRRVTEAEVIGTDSNDKKVTGSASTNPNDGRFIRRNIGYVTSSAEAQDIAENLIAADSDGGSPESTEHGRINAPLDEPATSNLNASIQVINSEINVDDQFTVVEQKDFFHQSQSSYSFEFEKELESRERRDKKDLGNRNSELITESDKDVGNQDVETGQSNSNVSSSTSTDYDDANANSSTSSSATADALGLFTKIADKSGSSVSITSFTNLENFTPSGYDKLSQRYIIMEVDASTSEHIRIQLSHSGKSIYDAFHFSDGSNPTIVSIPHVQRPASLNNEGNFDFNTSSGGGSNTIDYSIEIYQADPHSHTISSGTTSSGHGGEFSTEDHNISANTGTSDSGHGGQNTDPHNGSTKTEIVGIFQQDETNRN